MSETASDVVASVTATATAIATATATALTGAVTATATPGATQTPEGWLPPSDANSSLPLGMDGNDVAKSEGSYFVNTLIGLLIILVASVLNALGLNITKLDHQQQQAIPKRQQSRDFLRPLWVAGMGIYIASQMFGSPLALKYMRPDWVAPLGASSLVFNFLFAYWLVGTPVTQSDIRGTALIVLGVILIVIFSSINRGLEQSLTIDDLSRLWSRGAWISYFLVLALATWGVYFVSNLLHKVVKQRASFSPLPSPTLGRGSLRSPPLARSAWRTARDKWRAAESFILDHLERLLQRTDDARVAWLEGIGWAVCGGSLAGLCLVFTKAVVKIFWLPGHPLVHVSAIVTLLLVIGTAVLQIVCLNSALQCADTVVVVPLFYAGYTVFGFINALIFYDQTGQYARWVLVAVFLSIGVLIGGVVLLSTKPQDGGERDGGEHTVDAASTDPAIRMRPVRSDGRVMLDATPKPSEDGHAPRRSHGEPGGDVVFDVGEDSDESGDEDGDEDKSNVEGKGVGGTKESRGERGGLLLQADDEEGDLDDRRSPRPAPRRLDSRPDEDEEEVFGGFASAR